MILIDLISWLEQQPQDAIVPHGFGAPHSFRGNYCDLAFEPVRDARIRDMLAFATSAMESTFEGYKGGEHKMTGHTECWIAPYGECWHADMIGATMLRLWEYCISRTEAGLDIA